ncbi:glycosyltransferase [Mycobacterium tuberculosis]|nr:glycosyltransferase [Mycobacterium tuberculosis]
MSKHSLHSNEYYLIVGRFVPENNYEFIIREFMKSETRRNLIIISNVEQNKFFDELKSKTNFTSDDRIKFVGTVYDTELLKKIREQAFGYLHGHEVGGTNPSLLEALASTNLNILLGVNFNVEVGRNAALYFTKNTGSLTALIGEAENLDEDTIIEFGKSAKQEIISRYSWEHIVYSYENLFLHFHSSDKENIKFQNEMDLINFNKKQLKIEG